MLQTFDDFPKFMKHRANRIATSDQATPGVEGYIFDGADGSQMAFWTCPESATSDEHSHEYDEYVIVVQGCYTLIIQGERIPLKAGDEYMIPRGVRSGGGCCRDEDDPCVWRSPGRAGRRLLKTSSREICRVFINL